ncbi:MAG: ribonuclease P protein component [Legionellales bacterium]|nr:ribonuclease P protein component [Legionellales bacterium]
MVAFNYPKQNRLQAFREYRNVMHCGKKIISSCFVIYSKQNFQQPKLGIIVAKKQVKLSVKRNGIKRIIRESFRHAINSLPHHDFVVIVRHRVLTKDSSEVRVELNRLWEKLANVV